MTAHFRGYPDRVRRELIRGERERRAENAGCGAVAALMFFGLSSVAVQYIGFIRQLTPPWRLSNLLDVLCVLFLVPFILLGGLFAAMAVAEICRDSFAALDRRRRGIDADELWQIPEIAKIVPCFEKAGYGPSWTSQPGVGRAIARNAQSLDGFATTRGLEALHTLGLDDDLEFKSPKWRDAPAALRVVAELREAVAASPQELADSSLIVMELEELESSFRRAANWGTRVCLGMRVHPDSRITPSFLAKGRAFFG